MAKLERTIQGYDFDEVLKYFHDGILESFSASYEDGSDYLTGSVRCALRVYERYTLLGDNRLSLTLMLVEEGDRIFLSAISAAGGNGVVKFMNWGEDGFLNCLRELADQLH